MKLGLSTAVCNIYHDKRSILFSGTDDYIAIDGVVDNMNVNSGTMSCWVKGQTESGSVTFVMASGDAENFIRLWWHHSATKVKFTMKRSGELTVGEYTIEDFQSDGLWHHIAATWDTSAGSEGEGEVKFYVDGTQRGSTVGISGDWGEESNLISSDIGRSSVSGGAYYNGYIDEVSIYRGVADASLLYNSGHPIDLTGTSTDLMGYWKLDEGIGTKAFDGSGQGNAGTLTNSPVWTTDIKL
tara:strand:+ start:707 stop:1429 length:723 start_codon:yes stop_codon:yes gene_type:complete